MLLLPFPGIFQELLTGKVLLGYSHILELGHHLAFRGDGRVVRSRHPARILAVHAGVADEDVVQGVVEHVPHMEDSGHVRRRYDYGVWFPFVRFRMEALVFQPPGIPLVFHFRRIVFCGEFFLFAHISINYIQEIQI